MQKTSPGPAHILVLERLSSRHATAFDLKLSDAEQRQMVEDLDLIGLAKFRFSGEITPEGKQDWRLTAKVGASVTQACVVTLAPVKTRIDEEVSRHYVPAETIAQSTEETETELNDELDPIPDQIDLLAVATEALALALPDYPRADDAPQDPQIFGPDGVAPMTDEDANPFAGLAALKDKLSPK